MALTATVYNFDIELADTDRQVYESLAVRVARHPSVLPQSSVVKPPLRSQSLSASSDSRD